MTPEERSLRAKIAAHTLHAKYDPHDITEPARAGWRRKFLRAADPDGVLPEAERARRAEHLLRAHMYRMALASARARRRRSGL